MDGTKRRPRLLIISRKRSRAFTNVGDIATLAKKLGYRVVVAEPDADLSGFSQIINSCDVVMGVHGAGLTNIVFLPENAVFIQVIPFGGAEWLSRTFFEEPAKAMNIRYLDYKIRVEESTLLQQYPADHVVLRDPSVIGKQGWLAFRSIYFQKQNVTIDVNRFRPTLVKALELFASVNNNTLQFFPGYVLRPITTIFNIILKLKSQRPRLSLRDILRFGPQVL
ncbi:hypothetical protein OIU78_017077 [Salix suchowensis]|nr:hypothetical protein OIU78_017077 [Salix suchowensis]